MRILKRVLSILLILMMVITLIPNIDYNIINKKAYATQDADIDGQNGGKGTGDTDVTSGNGTTWDSEQQGYRFTIVDRTGTAVFKSVDILRTNKNFVQAVHGLMYAGYRKHDNINSKDNADWDKNWISMFAKDIKNDNKPILNPKDEIWALYLGNDGKVSGRGEAFYNWFLTGDVDKSAGNGDLKTVEEEREEPIKVIDTGSGTKTITRVKDDNIPAMQFIKH